MPQSRWYVVTDGRLHQCEPTDGLPPGTLVWRPGTRDWTCVGRGPRWWLELEDPAPVLEGIAHVLQADPEHEPTLRALEAMVRAGRAAQRAATLLEHVLAARGHWARLVDIRYDILAVTDDPAARVRVRLRIAETLSTGLGDHDAAFAACREAFGVAPSDPEVLAVFDRIVSRSDDWAGLAELYARRLPELNGDAARILRLRLASIHASQLEDPAASGEHLRLAVAETAATSEAGRATALRELGAVSAELGAPEVSFEAFASAFAADSTDEELDQDWDIVAERLEAQVAKTGDPAARARLADLYQSHLPDDARAIEHLQHLANRPEHRSALVRALERSGRWAELAQYVDPAAYADRPAQQAAILEGRVAANPNDRALRHRIGQLYRDLGDAPRAIPHFEAAGDHDALIPLYEEVGCWFDLVDLVDDTDYADRPEMRAKLLEARLALEGTDVAAWERLAGVREQLGDRDGAFVARAESFRVAPDRRAVPELEANAPSAARLAEALEGGVHALPELHRRLGELYRDTLSDDASAIAHFESVDDRVALAELYERGERWADLARIVDDAAYAHRPEVRRLLIEARIAREGDGPVLRARLGEVRAALGDPEGGFDECARAFVEQPTPEGLEALYRLAGERTDALMAILEEGLSTSPEIAQAIDDVRFADRPQFRARLLEARLAQAPDDPERWARLAELRAALGDADGAFDAWRVSFEAEPTAGRLRALEGVAAGRISELVTLLERVGERAPDSVRRRTAELCRDSLRDDARALRHFEAVERTPEVVAALTKLYERTGRWASLADIADDADYAERPEIRVRLIEAQVGSVDGERRAELLGRLAAVRTALGDHDGAFAARADALAAAPGSNRLEVVLDARRTRPDQVAAALESALAQTEDGASLHHHLGELYRELGDVKAAIPHYEALGDELILAELYERSERWDDLAALVDDAAYARRPAIRARLLQSRIDKGETELWPLLATVRGEAGDDEATRGAWKGALDAAQDDDARAAAHRGLASLTDDDTASFEHLRSAHDLVPADTGTRGALAEAHESRGDWAALAEVLEGAPYVPVHGDVGLVLNALSAAREARGELPPALADLITAFEQSSDDARFGPGIARLAEATDAWAPTAACYESVCDGQPAIHRRLAEWYLGPLQTPDRAVRHLQTLLAGAPDDSEARDALERALALGERWAELAASLEAREPTPDRLRLLANLRIQELDDVEGAIEAYEALMEQVPDDMDATARLSRLYAQVRRWEDVVRVLALEAVHMPPDEAAAQHVRIGEINEELLDDVDGAMVAYRAALAHAPTHPAALEGLERCFTTAERWDELVALCRGLLAIGTPAADVRRRLDWLTGRVSIDASIDAYREVLAADPSDAVVVQSLVRLCRQTGRASDIAETYLRHLPTVDTPARIIALRTRLASVCRDELQTNKGAIEALRPILEIDPEHGPTLSTLAGLYASVERWEDAVGALDSLLRIVPDAAAQVGRRRRIAEICELHLDDLDRAFAERKFLFVATPHDVESRLELEALAERTGRYDALAQAYVDALSAARDLALGRELRLALARVRMERLDDAPGAEAAWRGVLDEVDAADPTAIAALESVYTESDRDAELAALLERRAAAAAPEDRVDVALRLARLYGESLGQPGRAVDHLRVVLEVDPHHARALSALAAIYAEREAWTSLYDVRERQLELASDDAARRACRVEMARLAAGPLGRPNDAISLWRDVLTGAPDDVDALSTLEALLTEHGRSAEARDVCARLLELAESPEVQLRMARLWDGAPESLPHWRAVLEADPESADALWALWMDAQRAERSADVATLGERLLATAAPDDPRMSPLLRAVARAHVAVEDTRAAIIAWERLTDIEGEDDEAMAALEPLYTEVNDANALQALMAWKLTRADENEALRLRRRSSELHEGEGRHGLALDELLGVFDDRPDATLSAALIRLATATDRWDEVEPRLVRALEVEPGHAATGDALETRYVAREAWPDQLALLQLRAEHSDAPRDFLVRAARLQGAQLDEPEAAAETWRHVRTLDLTDPEPAQAIDALWPRLLARADGQAVVSLLLERLESTETAGARRSLYISAAEVIETRIGSSVDAFHLLSRAFRENPEKGPITAQLERLASETLRWRELAELYEEVLPRVAGANAVALQCNRAQAYEQVGDSPGAVAGWRGALDADEACAPALDALEGHFERAGRWADLLDVLRRRATRSSEPIRAWRRVAALAEDRVGDIERAVEAWGEVSRHAPDDLGAQAALDRLLAAAGRRGELAEVWAGRLAQDDDPELRVRLGGLYRELDDPERAVECLEHIAEHPDAAAQLAEIYAADERWEDCARVWEHAPVADTDAEAAFQRAMVCLESLADTERAQRWLTRTLEIEPHHRHALQSALALAEQREDWPEVASLLDRLQAIAADGVERAALLTRLAAVHEDELDDQAAAIEHYRQAVAADPGNLDVVAVLAQRHITAERWSDAEPLLATLVVSGRGDANERAEKHALHGLCAERMAQDDIALGRYRRAFELDSTHRAAVSGMARLAFRYEAWDEAFRAGQALLVHHGGEMSDAERADALWRQGAILAARGDDDAETFFRRALEADPNHAASIRGLETLDETRLLAAEGSDQVQEARQRAADAAEAAAAAEADEAQQLAAAAREAEAVAIAAESAAHRQAEANEKAAAERFNASAREIDAAALAEAVSAAASARIAEVAAERLAGAATDRIVEAALERVLAAARVELGEDFTGDLAKVAREGIAEAAKAGLADGVAERIVEALEEDDDDAWATEPPRRMWPLVATAIAVAVAGVAVGLSFVLYDKVQQQEEEQERARAAYGRLVDKVAATQDRFREVHAKITGEESDMVVVERGDPETLSEHITDLTVRDLEMRSELGQIERMLAGLSDRRSGQKKATADLEGQVSMLEMRLGELRSEQGEVQARIAERLDNNIHGIETALSRAGLDYEKMLTPDAMWLPRPATGPDTPGSATGTGGPRHSAGVGYVSPVPGQDTAMSSFGPRGKRHHDGVDIPAPIGTAVRSVAAGEVVYVQDMESWLKRPKFAEVKGKRKKASGWRAGVYVEIRHGDGRVSRYMHLGSIAVGVKVDKKVRAGEVIGSVGRTAVEHSDTHLHFELRAAPTREGDRFGRALDPEAPPPSDAEFLAGTSLLRAASSSLPPLPAVGAPGHLTARETRLHSLEKLLTKLPLAAPLDKYRVSSHFGKRVDPLNKDVAFHSGVDFPGRDKTPIRATAPGKVVHAGEMGRYGTLVEIDHGNGIRTRYGHLHKALVHVGQKVKYRHRIALMGSTGRSTGTHLHYEVRVDGKPRDPLNFIEAGRFVFKR